MRKTGSNVYSLDTNIVIDLLRGERIIADKINSAEKVYLPIHSLGELFLGAENSTRKMFHLSKITTLLSLVEVLNTSTQTAEIYGVIKNYLRKQGTPIPENDIWIAALSKEYQLPLVTNDVHFKHIPDLRIIEW